ncbi:hypothetical protein PP1_005455 [Pseudonocardia sp. P1]|nr:hypothetical protein Ae707Ps1_2182 [Pseudonocardia sp. Ae707_Ps1]
MSDGDLDFSHLSEAERAVLIGELVKLRDRRNGSDPESVLRKKVEELEKVCDRLRSESAHWRRKYFELKDGGQT